uniref:ABC transmembrane type-1 domain-containing protein n=1 Tax=Anopheles melas TaxID=34690 RepID=A0A182TKT2_9DIPT
MVLRLILVVLWLRCLVSLDRLTVHLRDESALTLNVVRDGTLVTVGIDQVVLALNRVILTSLLLAVNITGMVIMHIVVILVVHWSVMLLFVMVVLGLVVLLMSVVALSTDGGDKGQNNNDLESRSLMMGLILVMLWLRCMVSLDRLTVHLRDESALAFNVVRDGTLVTVGIDQ